jgi:hypothetical protein
MELEIGSMYCRLAFNCNVQAAMTFCGLSGIPIPAMVRVVGLGLARPKAGVNLLVK